MQAKIELRQHCHGTLNSLSQIALQGLQIADVHSGLCQKAQLQKLRPCFLTFCDQLQVPRQQALLEVAVDQAERQTSSDWLKQQVD